MYRRLFLVLIIIYLSGHTGLQIVSFSMTQLAYLIYTAYGVPLKSKSLKFVEVFNEATIFCICMILPVFTDFVFDQSDKYSYGWYFILIFCVNFLVNMIYILIEKFIELKATIVRCIR